MSVSCRFSSVISCHHNLSIHTFCDTSQFTFAAAVFIHIEYSVIVLSVLQWNNVKQHWLIDSTMALSWIQQEEIWSVFVNNGVQDIRELIDPTLLKNLPGVHNFADLFTRGCSAHQLSCSRWWDGPKWLLQTEENWPVTKPVFEQPSVLEEKQKTNPTSKNLPIVCSLNHCKNNKSSRKTMMTILVGTTIIFQAVSKYYKWNAWMKRFIFNYRNSVSQILGEWSHVELK